MVEKGMGILQTQTEEQFLRPFRLGVFALTQKGRERVCFLKAQDVAQRSNSRVVMRRLTTGIGSEKCAVGRFRRCAIITECTYTTLDNISLLHA